MSEGIGDAIRESNATLSTEKKVIHLHWKKPDTGEWY